MLHNLRQQLTIAPVKLEHLEQYDELMRYVFQVTEKDLRQSGYEENELPRVKRPILQKANVLGWFTPEGRLISSICTYPFKVNIHGRIYKMGGLSGVGTYPEYANMGLMNDLIALSLQQMQEAGQYISYLYPYSIPYYRRKGWEIMSDHITFTLKDTQIPNYVEVPGHVERLDVFDENVKCIYNHFSQTVHGALIRSKFEWDEYWRWENTDERTAAVYYNASNKPMGYVFYWVEDDVFHIKEMIYNSQEACHGLWNFVRAHFSMVDEVKGNIYMNEPLAFQLDDSYITETIEPYFMARIVDVESFLQLYPFDDTIQPFHFKVTDSQASWNNRTFGLKEDASNSVLVVDEPLGRCVELDIQTLTALMMSYKSPAYLYKVGRLKTDLYTLRILEKLIPAEAPYFSDYF